MGRKSQRRSRSRSISKQRGKDRKKDRSREKRRREDRENPSVSRKKSKESKKTAQMEQSENESPSAKRKRRSHSGSNRKERHRPAKKKKRSRSIERQEKPETRSNKKEKTKAQGSRHKETRDTRDDKHEGEGQKSLSGDQLRGAKPQSQEAWGTTTEDAIEKVEEDERPKEEANFEVSGLLALEDNSRNNIPLKFTEPPDACVPVNKWRFYIFKKGEEQKVIHLHRQTGFLFGKERRVADIPTDHCTCSKQHAVMHFRRKGEDVLPYIMDLESTNGTFLNGKLIEPARYVEMKHKDVVRFGSSTRELVLLNADK